MCFYRYENYRAISLYFRIEEQILLRLHIYQLILVKEQHDYHDKAIF